jgi:hypothetical protein
MIDLTIPKPAKKGDRYAYLIFRPGVAAVTCLYRDEMLTPSRTNSDYVGFTDEKTFTFLLETTSSESVCDFCAWNSSTLLALVDQLKLVVDSMLHRDLYGLIKCLGWEAGWVRFPQFGLSRWRRESFPLTE